MRDCDEVKFYHPKAYVMKLQVCSDWPDLCKISLNLPQLCSLKACSRQNIILKSQYPIHFVDVTNGIGDTHNVYLNVEDVLCKELSVESIKVIAATEHAADSILTSTKFPRDVLEAVNLPDSVRINMHLDSIDDEVKAHFERNNLKFLRKGSGKNRSIFTHRKACK